MLALLAVMLPNPSYKASANIVDHYCLTVLLAVQHAALSDLSGCFEVPVTVERARAGLFSCVAASLVSLFCVRPRWLS